MTIQGILFDLDGTLANTIPLCIAVYRQTFESFLARPVQEEEITAHFGISEEGIIRRLIPDHVEAGLQFYHEMYEKLHDQCSEPFQGIKTALELLKQREIKMAVVTGKGAHTAQLTLRYLGLDSYFDIVEAGDAQAPIKVVAIKRILNAWSMEAQHAAYIGDADTDMLDAIEAGVIPLAACWSETSTMHQLKTATSVTRFNTVQDFILWINKHIPIEARATP